MNATVYLILAIVFVVLPIAFLKQWFIGNRFTGNRLKDRYGRHANGQRDPNRPGRDA